MSFIESITNSTETLNGALTHKSTLSACLDLFSMGISSDDKYRLISNALDEDIVTATKVVFYLRDVRGGQGNKDIARTYHAVVTDKLMQDDSFYLGYIQLLPYLPQIGYWKDFFNLYGLSDELDPHILHTSSQLIYEDALFCKWFPRQSKLHHDLAAFMGISLGDVRRQVVELSKTVEQQMCAKQWSEINYSHVPSVANKRYANAFKRNDADRYQAHLDAVMSGKSEMKSSVLYPHEIASMVTSDYGTTSNSTADALWKSLPNFMSEASNILPVIDTSGSMWCTAYSNYKAIDIAIGLGLYFASNNTGSYKDVWCNFSTTPNFYKLSGQTLSDKVRSLNFNNWSMSTNIQAVFDRILTFSDKADVPKAVLIVSDMEFDCTRYSKTNFEVIRDKYAAAGIEMPTLIFWRVNVLSAQSPVTQHESGSILINGYSPSIMKLICSMDLNELKAITPLKLMNQAIEPYNYVDVAFNME